MAQVNLNSKYIEWQGDNNEYGISRNYSSTLSTSDYSSALRQYIPANTKFSKVVVYMRIGLSSDTTGTCSITIGGTEVASGTLTNTRTSFMSGDVKSYFQSGTANAGLANSEVKFTGTSKIWTGCKCWYTWYIQWYPIWKLTVNGGTGGGEYNMGSSVTIEATVPTGYKFVKWSDGNTSAKRTVTVSANATYTAQFEKITYEITASGTNGTVTGGGSYDEGATATLTATPNTGYKFVKWSDGDGSNPRTVTVTSAATYTAIFNPIYVSYDTILSYHKWQNEGLVASNGVVSNITNTGFTLTSNADVGESTVTSPLFPVQAGKQYKVDIDFAGDNWDVYICFYDDSTSNGLGIDFSDGGNRFSSTGHGDGIFTAPSGATRAAIRVDANGAGNSVTFSNFRIYPANYPYMSNTVLAIERTDVAAWSMPTPTREDYIFEGWNIKSDGSGIVYTSGSAFPTDDLILYSQWKAIKINKIYIDTLQPKEVYFGTTLVKEIYIDQVKVYG